MERAQGWAGEVKVVKNGYLGCWEFEFYPSKAWRDENPAAHPELMFTPQDSREAAEFEALEWAKYTALNTYHNKPKRLRASASDSGTDEANERNAMRFLCHYIPRESAPQDAKPYYRTIDCDGVNEARMLAERMTRKGYICKEVKQQLFKGE